MQLKVSSANVFKCISLDGNVWILLKMSLKFVPKFPINNIPALAQIMAWRRPGDKPLSEPMMVSLLTHICVTRPQWVKTTWRWKEPGHQQPWYWPSYPVIFCYQQLKGHQFHIVDKRITCLLWFRIRQSFFPKHPMFHSDKCMQQTIGSRLIGMNDLTYRQTSNIRCILVGNNIFDHSDVLGASSVGAAPATTSFSTARWDEKDLSFGIWCI